MKKIFVWMLVLTMMVSFAACSSQKLTMRDLIEANQAQVLLENHESIYIHETIDGELNADYYLTDAYSYEKHETWSMYLSDDAGYVYENGMYYRIVYLTADGLVDHADYRADQYADVIFSKESLREKIQSVDETEDQITVTCTMKQRILEKIVGEESVRSLASTYTVEAETYDMITAKSVLTLDDGTTVDFLMECSYNEQMPEEIKRCLEYENQTDDLRTITLVFHSGTEKEKTESVQAPKGLSIGLAAPSGSNETISLYADAACTEPYTSNGDYTSDVTIYIQ